MEFRILGSLEVQDGERVLPVVGGIQRLLLAMLLAEQGHRLSRDALTESLWPDRAPGAAQHALDLQVSRLRRLIGGQRIVTLDGGYRLDLSDTVLDADRFRSLVAAAANQTPSATAELLREALGLWRGPAFGDLGSEEPLRASARTLEDERLEALEALLDAELALGRHAAVVRELEAVVSAEPLRERPREQLMLALYRCGRQSDALRIYEDLRRRLSDELGIVPSERVRRLHEAILRQDPSLQLPAGAAPPAARTRRRPRGDGRSGRSPRCLWRWRSCRRSWRLWPCATVRNRR
jgi:DNA-binding SARP family transcriptional activator